MNVISLSLKISYCTVLYSVDMLDKGMIHVPGRLEGDGTRFHHATQNSTQFKTYELCISGIFHLKFLDCG